MDEPAPVIPSPHSPKLAWILSLVLVFLLGLFASYLILRSRPTQPVATSQLILPASTPTVAPLTIPANWLTYTDSALKYEVSYPPTYTVKLFPDSVGICPPQTTMFPCLIIQKATSSSQTIFEAKLKAKASTQATVTQTPFSINSLAGTKYVIADPINEGGLNSIAILFSLPNSVSLTYTQNDTYDQILSTFKFTTPVISPNPDSNVKTFTSANLGISFNYLQKQGDETFAVKELGNKVYVYWDAHPYTQGQYVEVFKSPTKYNSLDEALTSTILKGYDPQKCILSPYGNKSETTTQRVISPFANSGDDLSVIEANAKNCPSPYTATNGIAYFQMDNNHPNTFVFFSIGQYPIEAGDKLMWQDTLKFTN